MICLGISPSSAHCWVISKETLLEHVIGHQPQHTGSGGTETFWFEVIPDNPPEWLKDSGGSLEQAFNVLKKLGRR